MKTSQIVANVAPGLAKTNHFTVLLTPPASATKGIPKGNTNLQKVLLFCDTAQLPGVNVNTMQTRTYGEVREMPYELNYEPITMTFYVDSQMYVKKMFDNWTLGTQIGDSRKFNYYDNYVTNMKIFVQDAAEKNRYVVELFEAYPKTVSAVSMDYASRDIMKISVTMMYKYWRSTTLNSEVVKRNITSNGGFGLQNVQGLFNYAADAITGGYYSDFLDFQDSVNQNLQALPEQFMDYTGFVPADL